MSELKETGIQKLRRLVNMAGWCNESAFDDIVDIGATVRLLEACRELDLETLPDQLTRGERKYAAKHGKLTKSCIKRLYIAEFGRNWKDNLTGTDLVLFNRV